MNTTYHPELDWHAIEALLDRLDPAPGATCQVEGCTHLTHASFVGAGVGTV